MNLHYELADCFFVASAIRFKKCEIVLMQGFDQRTWPTDRQPEKNIR